MYPMDFEEFLWALNEEELSKMIREYFNSNEAFFYTIKLWNIIRNILLSVECQELF